MSDISVVIPTFNRLWSLPDAVQSCRSSACRVETIVVDDGSTDGTWEWLQTQNDVVAIRTDNWGKDWAVVSAMARARGEYVRFLDSDDWLNPKANDEQLELARQAAADVVVAGYEDYEEATGERTTHAWVDSDDFIAQQLGEGWSSHYSAFLFRREFIRDIPHRQEFALRDDRMFVIEVALRKPRLAIYREPAFVHRHHASGRLQKTSGLQRSLAHWTYISIYRKALGMLAASGELTARRKQAAIDHLWPLARNLAKTHPHEARDVVDWIFQLNPQFDPPIRRSLGLAYKVLGFTATERLLRFREALRPAATGRQGR